MTPSSSALPELESPGRIRLETIAITSSGCIAAEPGKPICYKIPYAIDEATLAKYQTDFERQVAITDAFDKSVQHIDGYIDVAVPKDYWCGTPTAFWDTRWGRSEDCDVTDTLNAVCMERITPLPASAWKHLAKVYAASGLRDNAEACRAKQSRLVRLLLNDDGTQEDSAPSDDHGLSIAKALDLRLPTSEYIQAMTTAIAIMHWQAKLDSRGVKFFLGGRPDPATEHLHYRRLTREEVRSLPPLAPTYDLVRGHRGRLRRRETQLWMLASGQCGAVTLDDEGVASAARAFVATAPFLLSPRVWPEFSGRYLKIGREIVPVALHRLPERFIGLCGDAA